MKHIKPRERNARPSQVVSIVATEIIHTDAANDRGASQPRKTRPSVARIERVLGKGQYLGAGRKVSAFVWLDDSPLVAANET